MPTIFDMFEHNYANALELEGKAPTLVIGGVRQERMPDGRGAYKEQWVLYLQRTDKAIVLSNRSAKQIAKATGKINTDDWAGLAVTVYGYDVDAFGKTHHVFGFREASGKQPEPVDGWQFPPLDGDSRPRNAGPQPGMQTTKAKPQAQQPKQQPIDPDAVPRTMEQLGFD